MSILKKIICMLLAIVGVGCHPAPAQRGEFTDVEFNQMAESMGNPSVAFIQQSELQPTAKTILLDAREPKEYEVSHIDGAILAGYDDFDLSAFENRFGINDTIVVYCSVGYRSGKVAEQLQSAGYRNVFNLYGGLFAWANEGRPLAGPTPGQTQKVHGFNKKWAKWLRKEVEVAY